MTGTPEWLILNSRAAMRSDKRDDMTLTLAPGSQKEASGDELEFADNGRKHGRYV